MSTTAGELITEAMSLAMVLAGGETASGQDMETCLYSLNSMLDSWNTEPMNIQSVSYSVLVGHASSSFTVGLGGTVNVPRPTAITRGSFSRVGLVDYEINPVSMSQYAAIEMKGLTAERPACIWYAGGAPLATCYLWPVPNGMGDLHIAVSSQVDEFSSISDTVDLGPGARRAIAYSLAEEIGPKFGKAPDKVIVRLASAARAKFKRSHSVVPLFGEVDDIHVRGGGLDSSAATWG